MSVNQDQIQQLLSEVQAVLAQGNPRLPWGSSAQIAHQRQVLEQVRLCLQALLRDRSQPVQAENQAQVAVQAVVEDMNTLRSTLLHPLHSEVSTLMQQRTALLREIRQLEAHRDLLQSSAMKNEASPSEPLSEPQPDQAVMALDSALHRVFESLQKEAETYQNSLSQGLGNLHRLGQQSEAIFDAIVDRLAAQLERESALQNSSERTPAPLAMPYAGAELPIPALQEVSSQMSAPAIDSIHVLTELFDRLTVKNDELPVTVSVTPPRTELSSGREVPAELKSLFQRDLLNASSTIEINSYAAVEQETSFEQLKQSTSDTVSSAEELGIFTLEGIENLFDDEAENQSKA